MSRPGRSSSTLLIQVVRLREQCDELARTLLPSGEPLFGSVSLPLPNLQGSTELAFIRTTSWLYVHYFETGRVSVRFLMRRGGGADAANEHLELVRSLRTWSQHNIDPTSRHDLSTSEKCGQWFSVACGTRVPRNSKHWSSLLNTLLQNAVAFMEGLVGLLGEIETDENRDMICEQWQDRVTRDWPAYRFHNLIAIAAADLGRRSLDPITFFDRHGGVIRTQLSTLSGDSDLEVEARKIVEWLVQSETVAMIPISGIDIMQHFGIGPGIMVGKLLACARRLYDEHQSDKDALLARVASACADLLKSEGTESAG